MVTIIMILLYSYTEKGMITGFSSETVMIAPTVAKFRFGRRIQSWVGSASSQISQVLLFMTPLGMLLHLLNLQQLLLLLLGNETYSLCSLFVFTVQILDCISEYVILFISYMSLFNVHVQLPLLSAHLRNNFPKFYPSARTLGAYHPNVLGQILSGRSDLSMVSCGVMLCQPLRVS